MKSPKTLWEDYALRPGGVGVFFSVEGHFRINLREWNLITDMLSTKDFRILEEWTSHHIDQIHGLKVPLPNFRWRREIIAVHDAHHLITGYPLSLEGELHVESDGVTVVSNFSVAGGQSVVRMVSPFSPS